MDETSDSPGVERAGAQRIVERATLSSAWATLTRVDFEYRRHDGRLDPQRREVYHRGHGAAVLLYHRERRSVLLVRQFRLPAWEIESEHGAYHVPSASHADAGFMLEVPAGILEHDSPAATVIAEAREEAGVDIGEPRFLFAAYASPGSVTERLHYFEAPFTDATRSGSGGGLASEGEDIEVIELPIESAWQRVADGEIRDAKTIVLLQHALLGPLSSQA